MTVPSFCCARRGKPLPSPAPAVNPRHTLRRANRMPKARCAFCRPISIRRVSDRPNLLSRTGPGRPASSQNLPKQLRLNEKASPSPMNGSPHISIVIPIYNEQGILHSAVVDLRERLKPFGWSYEIILAENGSKDRTIEIGHELAE